MNLTYDEEVKCNAIIHTSSVAAGAMGVIPIGPADTFMITPTQIAMIIRLGAVFDIRVSENIAKSILSGLAASLVGRFVASTLLNFIPIVGWIIKGGTAAGLTEAIGWAAVAHFQDINENHSKFAGKKEGYIEASSEYETKLRRQAEEFLKKETIYEAEVVEFTQLIDELSGMITGLSTNENSDSPDVKEKIRIFEDLIDRLKKLHKEE